MTFGPITQLQEPQLDNGYLTISLDFELFWGVLASTTLEKYGRHIEAVHQIIPRLLQLFSTYEIHATWATVGMVYHHNKQDLLQYLPETRPHFTDHALSTYRYIEQHTLTAEHHFAPKLIQLIRETPGQEIGSHTYSHLFCLEPGIDEKAVQADIMKSVEIAAEQRLRTRSIIFPRNQYDANTLHICRNAGIDVFRGNELHPVYTRGKIQTEKISTKIFRVLDAYIKLSGHHAYMPVKEQGMINVRASRFLRPYSPKLSAFDFLKMRRIKQAMKFAATQKKIFHLWWHPHNFGGHPEENFRFLESILKYYRELNKSHHYQSANMQEIGKLYEQI